MRRCCLGPGALAGDWQSAIQRFEALPATGLSQLIRPLLVAWAEQGAGQTDSALGGLEPLLNDAHFRAAFAMHAALIADQAGRSCCGAAVWSGGGEPEFPCVQSAKYSPASRRGKATWPRRSRQCSGSARPRCCASCCPRSPPGAAGTDRHTWTGFPRPISIWARRCNRTARSVRHDPRALALNAP